MENKTKLNTYSQFYGDSGDGFTDIFCYAGKGKATWKRNVYRDNETGIVHVSSDIEFSESGDFGFHNTSEPIPNDIRLALDSLTKEAITTLRRRDGCDKQAIEQKIAMNTGESVIERSKEIFEFCKAKDDWCIQEDSAESGIIVFGRINRIQWSVMHGLRAFPESCTPQFLELWEEYKKG